MSKTDLTRGTVARSALWSIIEGGLAQFLTLGVFLVTAHYVPPAAFGLLATAMLMIEFYRQVVIEGVVTAVNTQAEPNDEDYNTCFFLVAGISAVTALLIFLFAPEIARLSHIGGIESVLRPVALLLLVLGLSRTHEAYLSRHLQFRLLAVRSFLSIFAGGGVGIAMAILGFGLWSLIAQQLVTAIVSLLSLWTACKWRPRLKTNRASIQRILRYSRHVSATGVTNFANTQADIAFTAYFLGPTDTGYYNAAKRIGLALNQIIATSLNRVAMPTMARLQKDRKKSGRVLLQAVSLTTTITAPVFAGIAGLAPDAIHLAMGDQWQGAAPILAILSLSYFLTTIGQYNQSVILVYNKPHWQTMLMGLYAVVNIGLFFVFVKFGVLAISIAFTARAIAFSPISIGLAIRLVDVRWRDYAAALIPAVAAASLMGITVALLRQEMLILDPLLRIIILVPLGAAIYSGLIWLLRKESILELVVLAKATISRA